MSSIAPMTLRVVVLEPMQGFGCVLAGNRPSVVSRVDKGSNAHRAGLGRGDVLLEVNGYDVSLLTQQQVVSLLVQGQAQPLHLQVQRMTTLQLAHARSLLKKQAMDLATSTTSRHSMTLQAGGGVGGAEAAGAGAIGGGQL